MKLTDLTIKQALQMLKAKEITSTELTQAHIDHIKENMDINAYITTTFEKALQDAKESDKKYADGTARSLEGIPFGLKDLFCTKDIRTTAASHMLENFIPQYDATITKKLEDAGICLLGKLNLDEYAMGSTNKTSYFGNVLNPYNKKLTPGGSSGGSAAAVAAGLCMAATGTDTGGSIRQPASLCGIVGIKPTYGLCSRFGIIAFASSLDHPGCFGRTVYDTALILEHMAGHDKMDSTSYDVKISEYSKQINPSVKGLKVGIIKEADLEGLSPEIKALWVDAANKLKEQGAEIIEVSLPNLQYALPAYYIIAPAEASANLARYDGIRYGLRVTGNTLDEIYCNTREQGFGQEVKRRILTGTFVLSSGYYDAYYTKAAKIRNLIYQDYKKAFEQVDVLLSPTTPTAAFELDKQLSPLEEYACDIFTVSANIAGVPGLHVPLKLNSDNLPIGLQLNSNHFEEQTLFNVGQCLEDLFKFDNTPSKILKK